METGPRQPPPRAIADRLHSAAIHVLRRLRVEDKALGLSGPRASALSVIVFRGPIAMGALAEAEQVRPPTITRLVTSLERAGLVRRVTDRADRRVQLVEPTAAGKRLLSKGRARRVERLTRGVAQLSEDDQRVLARAAALMEGLGSSSPAGSGRSGAGSARHG